MRRIKETVTASHWRDLVVAWHRRWCTPGRLVALRWAFVACWGGALLYALLR